MSDEFDSLISMSVTIAGPLAEVVLNGPSRGNAMGFDFFRELPEVFRALDGDPEIRAIILSGSGGNFSYGLDLPGMQPLFADLLGPSAGARIRTAGLKSVRELQASITAVSDCRTPVISVISGWCIGGGVDLIAATDIRVASKDARFSVREARVAMVADLGSLQRLVGIIGDGHLRELALTGGDIDSERAERIGLVNSLFEDEEATLAGARALAAEIVANSPIVLSGVKDVLDAERGPRVEAGLRYVAVWNAAFLPTADLVEAFTAFGERRSPVYRGE